MNTITPETQSDTKNKSILVVEDEAVLRRLLVTTLRGEGYTVIEAENGVQGEQQAIKHHPHLVLLDIIMPGMNGIEMLQKLRQDRWGKTARVMLLTNLDDIDDIEKAKQFGVHDYLVKSDWSLDQLSDEIKSKMKPRRRTNK